MMLSSCCKGSMEGNQTTNHRLKWNGSKTHSSRREKEGKKPHPAPGELLVRWGPPLIHRVQHHIRQPALNSVVTIDKSTTTAVRLHNNPSQSFILFLLPLPPDLSSPKKHPDVLRRPTRTATRCWFRRRRRKGAATTGRSRATPLLPSVPPAA